LNAIELAIGEFTMHELVLCICVPIPCRSYVLARQHWTLQITYKQEIRLEKQLWGVSSQILTSCH